MNDEYPRGLCVSVTLRANTLGVCVCQSPLELTQELHLLSGIPTLDQLMGREQTVVSRDALNTFYLRLYGVRHMVKDHSDSEKGNPLPPHRLLLSINSKGYFICTIPQTG